MRTADNTSSSNFTISQSIDSLYDEDWLFERDEKTYRVALLTPMCGVAGLWSPSCIANAQTAVHEINTLEGIADKPVELVYVNAATEVRFETQSRLAELLGANAIDAVVGAHLSGVREDVAAVVRGRVPYIYTPYYEGGEDTYGVFAIGETPHMQLGPAIRHLSDQYRLKKWALIGNDYEWPRKSHDYARRVLASLHMDIVYEHYLPLGSDDMRTAVEQIHGSSADGVLISLIGQDAVEFNRMFGEYGLHNQAIRLSCAIEENGLLASGAQNLERLFSSAGYFGGLNTQENANFREKYHGLHGGRAPMLNTVGQSTYEGLHFLSELVGNGQTEWRETEAHRTAPIQYKSARKSIYFSNSNNSAVVYIARADGVVFNDFKLI